MTSKKHIYKGIPIEPVNPFKVPEGYFEGLSERVMQRISAETPMNSQVNSKKIHLRPFLALAAAMTGLALIVYIVLQSITGSNISDESYDLAILYEAGITIDESVVAETFTNTEDSDYTAWEEDAVIYLSSNEIDLMHLLATE